MLTWRQGLTSSWTSELRVEAQQGRRVVGLGSHLKLWRLGVVELAAAQSRNGKDVARSRAVGYSFHGRRWSLGARDQRRDDRWSDLAWPVPGRAPTREMQVDGGLRFGRALVTAGGFLRETPSGERQRFARAGLSVPIGRGYLTLSGFRALEGAARGSTVSAMFTLPLSPASSMAAWVDRQGGAMRPGLSLQRSAPAGLGHGYRVVHQDDALGGRTQFDGSYAADAFRVDGSMTHTRRGTQLRAGLSGALVATRDGFFRAQDRSGSFAVVHLPDANTRIYRDHQVAAVTNARGLAIVPNLRAFQANRLDVETDDLSLSTRIDRPSIALVPGRRQVLRADFAAAAVRPLTLRLRTREGGAIPAGAVATMDGGNDTAPVGHGGLLYLELTRPVDAITVSWAGTQCRVPAEPLRVASDPDATLDVFCE
jgi:outer membrane usher protein